MTPLFNSDSQPALQRLVECAMQHGLEQMLQMRAAGSLAGFQFADFGDAAGEFLLQRERGKKNRGTFEFCKR